MALLLSSTRRWGLRRCTDVPSRLSLQCNCVPSVAICLRDFLSRSSLVTYFGQLAAAGPELCPQGNSVSSSRCRARVSHGIL